MIAKLAEPKIGAYIPRPFPRVRGGVWERDYIIDAVNFFILTCCHQQFLKGYQLVIWHGVFPKITIFLELNCPQLNFDSIDNVMHV